MDTGGVLVAIEHDAPVSGQGGVECLGEGLLRRRLGRVAGRGGAVDPAPVEATGPFLGSAGGQGAGDGSGNRAIRSDNVRDRVDFLLRVYGPAIGLPRRGGGLVETDRAAPGNQTDGHLGIGRIGIENVHEDLRRILDDLQTAVVHCVWIPRVLATAVGRIEAKSHRIGGVGGEDNLGQPGVALRPRPLLQPVFRAAVIDQGQPAREEGIAQIFGGRDDIDRSQVEVDAQIDFERIAHIVAIVRRQVLDQIEPHVTFRDRVQPRLRGLPIFLRRDVGRAKLEGCGHRCSRRGVLEQVALLDEPEVVADEGGPPNTMTPAATEAMAVAPARVPRRKSPIPRADGVEWSRLPSSAPRPGCGPSRPGFREG